jgi:hypothetical protein
MMLRWVRRRKACKPAPWRRVKSHKLLEEVVVATRETLTFKPGLIVLDAKGVRFVLNPLASSLSSSPWFSYSLGWRYTVDIVAGLRRGYFVELRAGDFLHPELATCFKYMREK